MKKLLLILLMVFVLPGSVGAESKTNEFFTDEDNVRLQNRYGSKKEANYQYLLDVLNMRRNQAAKALGVHVQTGISAGQAYSLPDLQIENLLTDKDYKENNFTEKQKQQFIKDDKERLAQLSASASTKSDTTTPAQSNARTHGFTSQKQQDFGMLGRAGYRGLVGALSMGAFLSLFYLSKYLYNKFRN